MSPRRFILAGLATAAVACGSLGSTALGVYTGNPLCVSGGVTITSQDYIPPEGGEWREFPRSVWACAGRSNNTTGDEAVSVNVSDGSNDPFGAFRSVLPPGTLVRVRMTLPDTMDPPLTIRGWVGDNDSDWSDRAVTVIGRVASMRQGLPDAGVPCGDPVPWWHVDITTKYGPLKNTAFFAGVDTVALQANNYGGMVFGTTASALTLPYVGANTLAISVSGCGDGDPSTIDGAVSGFIPLTTVARLGLPLDAVRQAPTQALAAMMAVYKDRTTRRAMLDPATGVPVVDINGKPLTELAPVADLTVPFTLETRHGVEGLRFALGLSLSSHTLDVSPNRANLAAVHRCAAAGVPVSYSGSGATTRVTCSVAAPKPPGALRLTKNMARPVMVKAQFTARRGQRYVITAANDRRSVKGRCSAIGIRGTCTVTAPEGGSWTVAVTPMRGTVPGLPVGKLMMLR